MGTNKAVLSLKYYTDSKKRIRIIPGKLESRRRRPTKHTGEDYSRSAAKSYNLTTEQKDFLVHDVTENGLRVFPKDIELAQSLVDKGLAEWDGTVNYEESVLTGKPTEYALEWFNTLDHPEVTPENWDRKTPIYISSGDLHSNWLERELPKYGIVIEEQTEWTEPFNEENSNFQGRKHVRDSDLEDHKYKIIEMKSIPPDMKIVETIPSNVGRMYRSVIQIPVIKLTQKGKIVQDNCCTVYGCMNEVQSIPNESRYYSVGEHMCPQHGSEMVEIQARADAKMYGEDTSDDIDYMPGEF